MIDIHCHYGPDKSYLPEEAADVGMGHEVYDDHRVIYSGDFRLAVETEEGQPEVSDVKKKSDVQQRIDMMDANDIEMTGMTVSPLAFMYWVEPDLENEFARRQNDALAEICGESDRLFFIPQVPVNDIDVAVDELERAVDMGGKGLYMATHYLGDKELDHEAFYPLWETALEHDLPILLHPYPSQLIRYSREELRAMDGLTAVEAVTTEYLYGEARAFARLVLGGVLDEYPDLQFILPHGGGMVPYQLGRFTRANQKFWDTKAEKPMREYLDNFYFDLTVHDKASREFLINFMGAERLLAPAYPSWDTGDDPYEFIDDLDLDERDRDLIVSENARELFDV